MGNKNILVIDDEEVINDAVKKIATSEGYSVTSALSGAEALKLLTREKFELAICDIMMPEMDGLQLLKKVKSRNILTEVIMISGYSTVANVLTSLYEGAIDFIPKPFTFDEIMSAISRGFKYIELKKEAATADDSYIAFVPCPPKYMKLGYSSWTFLQDEGLAVIGATDLFLKTISAIESIQLLNVNDVIIQANPAGKMICQNEMVHNLLAPIGGKIIERNDSILKDPTLLEKDPYFSGWIYKIIPADIEYDMKQLLDCSSERI